MRKSPRLAVPEPLRHLALMAGLGLGLVWVLAAGPGAAQSQDQDPNQEQQEQQEARLGAILQGLNKTTARVSTIEAPLDEIARFGTLEIVARACHKKPPTETPESTVFLEIVDVRPDSAAVSVFAGWMFASSPAVSAMEHPVYDIWVVDCRMVAPPQEAAAGSGKEAGDTDQAAETGQGSGAPKQE